MRLTGLATVDSPAAGSPTPTAATERLAALDVLRGVAIFGILVVNMSSFSTPVQISMLSAPYWTAPVDRAAEWLIQALFQSKFYTLFSFLFGLGMAIQMERIEGRGGAFAPVYVRRLLALLAIGLIHALLFWHGDVLAIYAVLGFVLLLARRCPSWAILLLALLLHLLPLAYYARVAAQTEQSRLDPEYNVTVTEWLAERDADLLSEAAEAAAIYQHGTVAEMFRHRLREHQLFFQDTLIYFAPHVLALFLLGLYAGRRRIFHDPAAHRTLWRCLACGALPAGVVCGALEATLSLNTDYIASWTNLTAYAARVVGAPLLAAGYAAVVVLLAMRESWARRLLPLAAVGRMALSNYLLQTLVCTTLCYSYGLRWFGVVTPARGLLLTLVIFAIQVPLSVLWARHFRFGPMEWLWRSATYLHWQPLRTATVAAMSPERPT